MTKLERLHGREETQKDPIPDDPGQARRWAASEAMKLGGRVLAPVTGPVAGVVSKVAGGLQQGSQDVAEAAGKLEKGAGSVGEKATELEEKPETLDIGAMLRSLGGR